MLRISTAKRLLPALLLAVFFSKTAPAQEPAANTLSTFETSLGDLVYGLSHSVVTVEASRRVSGGAFNTLGDEVLESIISSGVIVDTAGHIMVSAPMVVGRDRITVSYRSGTYAARLVATDYQTDLALLRCSLPNPQPVLFSGHQACAGQMVVAIGHAFGIRTSPSLGFCAGVRDDGMMQFSIPVATSAIGGGVFDMSGRLLAVINGGLGDDDRVTTAIPAYRVAASVDYLRRHGDRASGFLGITTREIEIYPGLRFSSPVRLASAEPQQDLVVERGILVTGVVPGSPAARARIQIGDLIYAVDNIFINSANGMAAMVQQSPPGRVLDIDFIRDNQPMSLQTVISSKTAATWAGTTDSPEEIGMRRTLDSLKQVLNSVQDQIERIELHLDRL